MQLLTLLMLVVVTTIDFLANGDYLKNGRFLPSSANYLVELLGAVALAFVIVAGARGRFRYVRGSYWLAFGAMGLLIVCGLLANNVNSGTIVSGLRLYLRAIPWFLVPAVFAFSGPQLRTQLRVLLALSLIQLPLAILQRIQTTNRRFGFVAVTGDWTTGTLGDPGVLCIFLVAGACILVAFYERHRLPLWQLLPLFLAVLVPTMINETKAMVILLPVALLTTVLCASEPQRRGRKLAGGVALLVVFGAIFVPVYNGLNKDRQYSYQLGDYFLKPELVTNYLATGSDVGSTKEAGRFDALSVPLRHLAKDPVSLAFGYGIGNASDSSLGPRFAGKYASSYRGFLQTAFSRFVLEVGVLGCALLFYIYWLIFQDCRAVARGNNSLNGAFAAGWAGVAVLMLVATFYASIEVFPSLGFLFWYFSGLVAAQRMRMSAEPEA
jgi:hypothetical protein